MLRWQDRSTRQLPQPPRPARLLLVDELGYVNLRTEQVQHLLQTAARGALFIASEPLLHRILTMRMGTTPRQPDHGRCAVEPRPHYWHTIQIDGPSAARSPRLKETAMDNNHPAAKTTCARFSESLSQHTGEHPAICAGQIVAGRSALSTTRSVSIVRRTHSCWRASRLIGQQTLRRSDHRALPGLSCGHRGSARNRDWRKSTSK